METKDFFLISIALFVAFWIIILFWTVSYIPVESRALTEVALGTLALFLISICVSFLIAGLIKRFVK
jgi:hypothetical protein